MTRRPPFALGRAVRLALVALLLLAASPIGPGSAAPVEPVATPSPTTGIRIPITPAGKQLAWLLNHINAGAGDLSTDDLRAHVAPAYLDYVPAPRLLDTIRGYVVPSAPLAVARFEGGVTQTRANAVLTAPSGPDWRISLSVEPAEPHRIATLFFEQIVLPSPVANPPKDWDALDDQLARLAPGVSFVAAEVTGGACQPIHASRADESLGIASSFKLYVLGELTRQLAAGEITWDELLAIDPSLVSLPSGDLRLQPPGTLLPVRTFTEQMISASDNTATDHLIARLGRERVESAFNAMGQVDSSRNQPLLLTREWFAIKMRYGRGEVRQYLRADTEERRRILAEEVDPTANTLSELEPWPGIYYIDQIEWFASAGDLCRALSYLQRAGTTGGMTPVLDAMSLNPGFAFDARDWAYVGYKAGFESGVNSVNWLLQRQDGRWFAVSGIVNDEEALPNADALFQLAGATVVPWLAEQP